jgi:hypothetical protein
MRARSPVFLAFALMACGGDDDGGGGLGPVTGTPVSLVSPLDVWAFAPNDVWIVDGTPTVHRFDGTGWSTLDTPAQGGVSCIFALSPSEVWLCAGTEVLRFDGASFSVSDVTTPTGLDGLTSIWASSATDVWAVGDDAIVARFDGTTWSRTIVGSPFKAAVWGTSTSDVYALDTFELQHWDGTQWSEIDLENGAGEGGLWGAAADDLWLVTGRESPTYYDGNSWTTIETDFIGDLAAIWGSSARDVWAVGSAGQIAHFDGDDWRSISHQQIGAPYLQQLVAVHGSGAGDVWIVGSQLGEGGATPLIYRRDHFDR